MSNLFKIFMLPLIMQILAFLIMIIFAFVSHMGITLVEKQEVLYSAICGVTVNHNSSEESSEDLLTVNCGERSPDSDEYDAPRLIYRILNDQDPKLRCEYREGNMTKVGSWQCELL